MADEKKGHRLTESVPGRLASLLLAVLWVYSMSGVDAHAFSSFPVCAVLVLVLGLVVFALLRGHRVVRMSLLGWFSSLTGGYFLIRCVHSYSVVDSWCEAVLILGAFVYYVAGVYAAQSRSYTPLFCLLGGALLLNVLAYVVVRQPWFCLEWTGRASQTQAGANSLPVTLFVYKNFAGVFLCLGAVLVGAWGLWMQRGIIRVLLVMVAAASVGVSFMCGTRAVYLVLPLLLVAGWLLYVLCRLWEDKKLGAWNFLIALLLLLVLGVAGYGLFLGGELAARLVGADSHLRFLIWSSICEILHAVPVFGCGANAVQWEIVPYYNEWQLPNYAHNEYLQVWVDYGLVGLLLVLIIVLGHVARGMLCLSAEEVSQPRKMLVALSCLVLLGMAAYAVVDFPWHSFALVAFTAFSAGVLASPYPHVQSSFLNRRNWAAGHIPVVPVVAQKWPGRMALLALTLALGGYSAVLGARLWKPWEGQWAYNELSRPGVDPYGDARRSFIAQQISEYPCPALADTYYMLPPYHPDMEERECLLKTAWNGNPRQLFTLTMLVDVLGARHKYEEAERLMRENYVGQGMPSSCLNNWPAYYAYNLLIWGRYEMQQGNHAKAISLMDYALKMNAVSRVHFNVQWRSGAQPWKENGGIKPALPQLLRAAQQDVHMLRLLQVCPDDSWQSPLAPGGKPALYRSWVNRAR